MHRTIRTIGTVILALGFVMLATAILIRDPTALDANIGAGALSLIGIPLGAVGLVLVLVSALPNVTGRAAVARPHRTATMEDRP